ncbi:MAG: hypothetical protein QS721_15265 [Candidatus Endonucleobacter sp. (ex Gigantidas childressi)]|nr:hypothetical protein [Candidatus Endonucleobacter sp. (ex Gigantidas childressi)]
MLAALAHPDHLLFVGSRGFAYLLPSSNLKCLGIYPSSFNLLRCWLRSLTPITYYS